MIVHSRQPFCILIIVVTEDLNELTYKYLTFGKEKFSGKIA